MGRAAEVVAGYLGVEEAEMLAELLAADGIDAWFEGAVASCLGPLIPGAGGGAKLLVPAASADRAREVIASSGIFRIEGASGVPAAAPADDHQCGRIAFPLYPLLVTLAVVGATVLRMVVSG